ncbi:MAG: hypothetical protein U0745_16270 [Polyangia bacterium]|jgi:hypothetical protein
MRSLILYSISVAALLNASCGAENTGGSEICPEGATFCTPGQPYDPNTGPTEKEVVAGPGTGSPFNSMNNGSTGVKTDPNGNIVLDGTGNINNLTSFIWVSQNGNGTISKVDTRTMKQVGAYVTYPGAYADPSRTTVSLGGDAVVANRASNDGNKASATKIAGDKTSCVDRNGNGKIDTYESDQPLTAASPFWWQANQMNSPDECVLWNTKLSVGSYPRAAGFDGKLGTDGSLGTYVYIGEYFTKSVVRLDAKTGALVKRIDVGVCPYGLVLDRAGNVWVQNQYDNDATGGGCGGLAKLDVNNNDMVTRYAKPSGVYYDGYGVTADARGYIYLASYGMQRLYRFIPPDPSRPAVPATGYYESVGVGMDLRGVGVDQNNQAFAAVHNGGMAHVDVSAEPPPPPATGNVASTTTMVLKKLLTSANGINGVTAGAAIDYDGKVWGVSNNMAYKIDPANNYSVTTWQPPAGTYTYSDMTGYQLRNASRAGVYRNIFTGCGSRTTWKQLSWNISAPPGTQATVRYRGALTVADLQMAPWQGASGISPSAITLPTDARAAFLEVEFVMQTADARITPILSGLSATFTCNEAPA